MLARTHLYTHTLQYVCVRVRLCACGRCQISSYLHSNVYLKHRKQPHSTCSVTVTYPFLPCVRALALGTSLFSRFADEPNAAGRMRRIPVETSAEAAAGAASPVVALPSSALQTAQRFTVRTGAARPSRVKVESRRETARQG